MLLAWKAKNRRSTRIEAEVENLEKNVKELDRHVEELAEDVRKHEEQ
jgi:archaellum component FlaC